MTEPRLLTRLRTKVCPKCKGAGLYHTLEYVPEWDEGDRRAALLGQVMCEQCWGQRRVKRKVSREALELLAYAAVIYGGLLLLGAGLSE